MSKPIEAGTLSTRKAKKVLSELDSTTPFRLRVEYIECLAAITACYSTAVSRIAPGPNRAVRSLFGRAAREPAPNCAALRQRSRTA